MSLASLARSLPTSVKPDFPEPAHICTHTLLYTEMCPHLHHQQRLLCSRPDPRLELRPTRHPGIPTHRALHPNTPWSSAPFPPQAAAPQRSQAIPAHTAAAQHSSAWLGISMCSPVGTHFSLGMYHPLELNQLLKEQNIRFNGSQHHKAQRVQEGSWEAELQGAQPHGSGGKQLPAAHGRAQRKGANGTCWMVALQNKNRSVAQAGRR